MTRRMALVLMLGIVGTLLAMPTAAAGGGCHASSDLGVTADTDDVGFIAGCAFEPTVMFIEPGDEITWTNKDPFSHTVTGAMDSWGNYDDITQGESVSYTFKEEGVFPYFCAYHPSMVGAVVVGDARSGLAGTGAVLDPADPVTKSSAQRAPVTIEADASSSRAPLTVGAAALGAVVLVGLGVRFLVSRRRSAPVAPTP